MVALVLQETADEDDSLQGRDIPSSSSGPERSSAAAAGRDVPDLVPRSEVEKRKGPTTGGTGGVKDSASGDTGGEPDEVLDRKPRAGMFTQV